MTTPFHKKLPPIIETIVEQKTKLPKHIGLIAITFSEESEEMVYTSTAEWELTQDLLKHVLADMQAKADRGPRVLIA